MDEEDMEYTHTCTHNDEKYIPVTETRHID